MKTIYRFTCIVVLFFIFSSCASLTAQKTAESLPKGDWEIGLGLTLYTPYENRQSEVVTIPTLEPTFRLGLTDSLDAEAKFLFGPIVNFKYTLPQLKDKTIYAIELGGGYSEFSLFSDTTKFYDFYLNYYHTIKFTPYRSFTLSPRLIYRTIDEGLTQDSMYQYGVNMSYQLLSKSGWSMTPEIGVFGVIGSVTDSSLSDFVIVTTGLGFAKRF